MNQSILSAFGATGEERVINALNAFKQGNGVLVLDDEDRENEGDLIFPAETITPEQMAKLTAKYKKHYDGDEEVTEEKVIADLKEYAENFTDHEDFDEIPFEELMDSIG